MLSTAVGRGYRLLGTWQVRHESTPAAQAASAPMQARVELFGRIFRCEGST